MKIIQVPYCFYPDPAGGTEVYVENLARYLKQYGVESIISSPAPEFTKTYFYKDLKVRKFTTSWKIENLSDLYGEGDKKAAYEFGKIIDDEKPDLIHLHAFTHGVSLRIMNEAKQRGAPVVFTYHTPAVTCQRGTLMKWGKVICGGIVDPVICASCALHGLGLPKAIAQVFGRTPYSISNALTRLNLSGGLWTALRMRKLIKLHHGIRLDFLSKADVIIVAAAWAKSVLLRNGIPGEKIVISYDRSSISPENLCESRVEVKDANRPLRIIFAGRIDPTKGIDIIIKAIMALPEAKIALDVFGIVQGDNNRQLLARLKKMAGSDKRISFKTPFSRQDALSLIKSYDVMVVPSQCVECGPLVLHEAREAGIPVVGSNLGTISEMINDGVDGLLVTHDSVIAWRNAFKKILGNKNLLDRFNKANPVVLTMSDAAKEVLAVYNSVTDKKRQS